MGLLVLFSSWEDPELEQWGLEAEGLGPRDFLIIISFCFQAVVSVDGRPVRLQLCDTAGQVSIMLRLSAGEEAAL